jgi:transcription initiation factor IIE alpha subunit
MRGKNEVKIIKKRFKCSKCKSVESHSLTSNKTTCGKCGSPLMEISEKEYIQYKNKSKKDLEEDIKETENADKKKKNSEKFCK